MFRNGTLSNLYDFPLFTLIVFVLLMNYYYIWDIKYMLLTRTF